MARWLPLMLLCLLCLCALTGDAHQDHAVVSVTAYARGTRTASGTRPQPGIIALSRDIERLLGVRFGQRVALGGYGVYRFEDRMPRQWHRRVDLYLPSRAAARQFGIQRGVLLTVAPLPLSTPYSSLLPLKGEALRKP